MKQAKNGCRQVALFEWMQFASSAEELFESMQWTKYFRICIKAMHASTQRNLGAQKRWRRCSRTAPVSRTWRSVFLRKMVNGIIRIGWTSQKDQLAGSNENKSRRGQTVHLKQRSLNQILVRHMWGCWSFGSLYDVVKTLLLIWKELCNVFRRLFSRGPWTIARMALKSARYDRNCWISRGISELGQDHRPDKDHD